MVAHDLRELSRRRGEFAAAETLAAEGIEVEIVDPRTISPLDEDTIYESVENTGRLVVVDESHFWHV